MQSASKFLVIAALTTAATATMADEADGSQNVLSFQGHKTRAEVQAELRQFKAAGVNPFSISYNPLSAFKSQKTRDEVRADFLASREETKAVTGEDSGSAYFAQRRTAAAPTLLAGQPAAKGH